MSFLNLDLNLLRVFDAIMGESFLTAPPVMHTNGVKAANAAGGGEGC